MDEERSFTFDQLIAAMVQLARHSLATIIPVFAVLAGVGLAADYYLSDLTGYDLLTSVARFVICYMLVKGLARHSGITSETEAGPGFGAYFIVSLVLGFGTAIGFMLLVVPGLVLMVRWLLAFPALCAASTRPDSRGALTVSWDMTGKVFWKLLAAYCVSILLMLLAFFAYTYPAAMVGEATFIASLAVANAASAMSTIFDILLGFAAFMLLRDDTEGLAEVFT